MTTDFILGRIAQNEHLQIDKNIGELGDGYNEVFWSCPNDF